ncbi:hypothetical protein [Fibrella forsythiae]|uniref:Uncharacterized protein n=1 Tax=Fibrella forsythiae TaxID=2817061 RepID=A0ABS3JJV9_9BACT|nr:hypothetical protein [Fibrella forsythiae]MBO0949187.1 hypothetical protein [Fibrella forsythiae]
MNPRIRPDSLDTSPYKELIGQLAYQWVAANRPAAGRVYNDYINTLRTLLLTTQNPERTTSIVGAVLRQAVNLDKTAQWVEEELKFEGMLTGVDRADFLLLELQQTGGVNDQLLDAYNERINRFATNDQ